MEPQEVDAYAWVPMHPHLDTLLVGPNSQLPPLPGYQVDGNEIKLDPERLRPPYPNKKREGISKAHNFALRHLLTRDKPKL